MAQILNNCKRFIGDIQALGEKLQGDFSRGNQLRLDAAMDSIKELAGIFKNSIGLKTLDPRPCVVDYSDGGRSAAFAMEIKGQGLTISPADCNYGAVLVKHPEHKDRLCNKIQVVAGGEEFLITFTGDGNAKFQSISKGSSFVLQLGSDNLDLRVGEELPTPSGSKKINSILAIDGRVNQDASYGHGSHRLGMRFASDAV